MFSFDSVKSLQLSKTLYWRDFELSLCGGATYASLAAAGRWSFACQDLCMKDKNLCGLVSKNMKEERKKYKPTNNYNKKFIEISLFSYGPPSQDLAASDFFLDPITGLPKSCPAHSDCLGDNFVPMPKTGYWVNLGRSNDIGLV